MLDTFEIDSDHCGPMVVDALVKINDQIDPTRGARNCPHEGNDGGTRVILFAATARMGAKSSRPWWMKRIRCVMRIFSYADVGLESRAHVSTKLVPIVSAIGEAHD
jgi:hypothetical protein